ncbi:MAG: helix-turn-helix transcriptional regulator [Bacteroides uniformis]|uniref:Bacterial regulatory proteins, luxR family n=2 Tax=Paraprevotella clara TaxID=454154 RepID=A0A6N2ZZS8_9BACT
MRLTVIKHFSQAIFRYLESKLYHANDTVEEHQRFSVFLYGSIILFIGIPLNLLGFTGPTDRIYFWMNTSNLIIGIIIFILYCYKRLKLKVALSAILIVTQLEILGEMLNCAFNPSTYHMQLIVGNLVLSGVLIMLSVVAYLRFVPIILCIICMSMYTLCILITDSLSLKNFYILYLLVFATICVLGERLIYVVKKLQQENRNLKQDEAELLHILRMNKQQVKAYVEFSKKDKPTSEDTERLLELIGERSQRNIINTVSCYLTEKQTEIDQIAKAFPELTASEHEICRLILQGKKLGEICEILGKTENNVTAHRGHIRKKLGLTPQENLKKALENRMK